MLLEESTFINASKNKVCPFYLKLAVSGVGSNELYWRQTMMLKSIGEAAERLGVSRDTIRRLASAGTIHTVRLGRRRLVPETEIERVQRMGAPSTPRHPGTKLLAEKVR
jgi:excisionase family DNA binding protein